MSTQFPNSSGRGSPPGFVEEARKLYDRRRAREDFFGSAMFGEPAWDILLSAYVTESVSAAKLTGELGLPMSVVSRWVQVLESDGLVRSTRGDLMPFSASLQLSAEGRKRIDQYFDSVKHGNRRLTSQL